MRFWRFLAIAPLLIGAAADPRPELVELQMSGRQREALQKLEQHIDDDPTQAQRWGFDYLQGHLLEQLQRSAEAPGAFQNAVDTNPLLTDYGIYRLARNQYESGRPGEAAALLADLLDNQPPAILLPEVIHLLVRALTDGAPCSVLEQRKSWRLDGPLTRQVQIPLIDCALEAQDMVGARSLMVDLLRGHREDEPALAAARRLATLDSTALDSQTAVLVGLTLFHHREFEQAVPFLQIGLQEPNSTRLLRGVDAVDLRYSLARSYYWQSRYPEAVQEFAAVADDGTDPGDRARALFQRGRSFALTGDWDAAVTSYRDAVAVQSNSSWAAAAMLSALRLEWRQGREDKALELFRQLRARGSWRSSTERAALFLATSDLVRGRTDRAGAWLTSARQARRRDTSEIRYWRGRLAELEGRDTEALNQYLALLTHDLYHPLAQIAQNRLHQGDLESTARELAAQLAESDRTTDLLRAWLLIPVDHPLHAELRDQLTDRYQQSPRTRPFLEMHAVAPEQWTVWRRRVRRSEDLLLTLGIVEAMSSSVRSAFPLEDTGLALAGSELLTSTGLHKRSLYAAEVIDRRVPSDLPDALLPVAFRRLLYPRPYAFTIDHETSRFGVDPDLLTAIIREESRFDPRAISPASARGLTQFVLPTAQRLAAKLDLGELHSADLHDPDIAITLGAAYLAELDRHFQGNLLQMIAAYNAGEDQARLWMSYCFSHRDDEYFTKVGYRQTRGYLQKVLDSRAKYGQIYADGPR